MKKKFVGLCVLPLLAATLVACNGTPTAPTTTATPTATTTVDPTSTVEPTSTPTATSTSTSQPKQTELCKLPEISEDSSFFNDGYGYATLVSPTDGDTASFKIGTQTVRLRFYSVNTPESTGSVEKWGKNASLFTEGKLNAAKNGGSIILEASEVPAVKDSYGERYLGYVWYKTADMADYVNLNLELVENGYSESHAAAGEDYYNYFKAAETYAKANHLHIWSDDDDPYYNDKAFVTTLPELLADLASEDSQYFNKEEGVGSKVSFVGYAKSVTVSSSGTYSFVAESYNEDGTVSSIELYGGYNSDSINGWLSGELGNKIHFVGTVQKHGSKFQVAIGKTYVPLTTGTEYTYRLSKDYYMTFDSSNTNASVKKMTAYRDDAVVSAVSEANGILTVTASVLKKGTTTDETETFTFKIPTPSAGYSRMVVGATFSVKGYKLDSNSNSNTSFG